MKKTRLLLLSVAALLVLLFAFSSCNNSGGVENSNGENGSGEVGSSGETEAHQHIIAYTGRIEPTCEKDGMSAKKYCSECGEVLEESMAITKLGHAMSYKPRVEPTCNEDGKTEGEFCSRCNKVFSEQVTIPATGNHTPADVSRVEPTCNSVGREAGKICSVCGIVLEGCAEIEKTEHHFLDGACINCGSCSQHIDENTDESCDKCGFYVHSVHRDSNKDAKCDECEKTMPNPNYPWENTNLLFKMTHNTHFDTLSSSCGQYLAGGEDVVNYVYDTYVFDDKIKERNTDAYSYTKVEITYDYYADTPAYQRGVVVGDIGTVLSSGSTKNIPDMYCNFVYDLVAASLSGFFANLMGSSTGTNYFEFNKGGYVPAGQEGLDPDKDLGYMYEYMRSTTLSDEKMYILASDYFIDMVRAEYVVPVNVHLLSGITAEGLSNNLQDFYEEVYNNRWTYDRLAEYAEAVHNQVGANPSLKNDILGFALPCEGLPASGILYGTTVKIIDKVWNPYLGSNGEYEYLYPGSSDLGGIDICNFADALSNLMNKPGVLAIDGSVDWYDVNKSSSLLAVRDRFCQDGVLFGGIECLGNLDNSKYQTLSAVDGRGFGVVPVPMYEEPAEDSTKTYTTSIHNVGRPGAITFRSAKFAECTAFLNYQSTHSSEILELYYEYNIAGKLESGDASDDTAKMLGFIRDNVGSSFDKIMDEAIHFKYYSEDELQWYHYLLNGSYDMEMYSYYSEVVDWKQAKLDELKRDFAACP